MLFIIMFTAILFYWLIIKALIRKTKLRRGWIDAHSDEWHQLTESLLNWKTVTYFGQVPREKRNYAEKNYATRAALMEFWTLETTQRGIRQFVPGLSFLVACAIAASQIANGYHQVGAFVAMLTYWGQLTSPLGTLASEFSSISQKLVGAEKMLVLLEKGPRVHDAPDAKPFSYKEGAVEFENVTFSYDGKRKISDGITFRARPGQTVALVGETGGGKSTILKLLFRIYDADKGRILIDGQNIRDIQMESFRKHIAIVPQDPALFNMTIMENVKYPNMDCSDEEAIAACKAAALHDKIMTFTDAYKEKVGERGTKLSGGELQRLAVARAIIKKPNILLLDEATSSVDSITEGQIQDSLRNLAAGKTAFVIAHRLSTILRADQILVIRSGQVAEAGTHKELIEKNGFYHELWASQLKLQASDTTTVTSKAVPILFDDTKKSDDPDKTDEDSSQSKESESKSKDEQRDCKDS
jgi:ABC-type transport system involved in Fe-S cluster assembly fused permease/ATPase subunit